MHTAGQHTQHAPRTTVTARRCAVGGAAETEEREEVVGEQEAGVRVEGELELEALGRLLAAAERRLGLAHHQKVEEKLHRPWFSGGTVAVASVQGDRHFLEAGAAAFEDGTLDYLNIPDKNDHGEEKGRR